MKALAFGLIYRLRIDVIWVEMENLQIYVELLEDSFDFGDKNLFEKLPQIEPSWTVLLQDYPSAQP